MATEYDSAHDAYGDQPGHAARPSYPGQSQDDGPGSGSPPPAHGSPPAGEPGLRRRGRRTFVIAVAVALAGLVGLAGSLWGLQAQVFPRRFTTAQRTQITDWEYGERWRTLTAGTIFPASVTYPAPVSLDDDPSLTLAAQRLAIASQSTCKAAADAAAAQVLDDYGCTAMLRATYVDTTDSYVVTVGAAVLPDATEAADAARAIAGLAEVDGLGPGVDATAVKDTPAASFTDARRQLTGVMAAGTYVVLYTVGYADSRPGGLVSGDSYADAEMTNAGDGVAKAVLDVLGAPVPAPACPGTPGC